ncbi:hypothetical protein HK104_007340 [Borealophlyctis nickersoniae]|nr:hypothetical protein HK104_007340 [Borealophlyctis nickersoniae]
MDSLRDKVYVVVDTESPKGGSILWEDVSEVCAIYVEHGVVTKALYWDEVSCKRDREILINEWITFAQDANTFYYYANTQVDYHRLQSLLGPHTHGIWIDALTTISRKMITTDSTATNKPYARSRRLKDLDEAMVFPNETSLVAGNMCLDGNDRKVRRDVKVLWDLILVAQYIVGKNSAGEG